MGVFLLSRPAANKDQFFETQFSEIFCKTVSPRIDQIVPWFKELGYLFVSFFSDCRIPQSKDDIEILKKVVDLREEYLYDYAKGGIG